MNDPHGVTFFRDGPLPSVVTRPWESFPVMVGAGLVVGFATGGYPAGSSEISQIALVVAMTFSLTEISFEGLSPRAELRGILLSLVMTYGVLSGLLLVFAVTSADPALRDGWVLMAAVPPAVAVVPVTSYLKGNVRRSLISAAFLYVLGLGLVPGITLAFVGRGVPVDLLFFQTLVLIGVPLAASRGLRLWKGVSRARGSVVAISFFFLIVAIAGSTRDTLLANPQVVVSLSLLSFLRTFALGIGIYGIAVALRVPREDQVAAATFSSFKNLGLTVVLAFSFFGAAATLPSIVSLVFEILWIPALPLVFRFPRTRRSGVDGG